MPLAPGDIIDAARSRHPSFNTRVLPPSVALNLLSQVQRRLADKCSELNPFYLTTSTTMTVDVDSPTALPANAKLLLGGTVTFVQTERPKADLRIVNYANRFEPPYRYSAFVLNQEITLVGAADNWTDVSEVRIVYQYSPITLDAFTDAIALPDQSEQAMISALAYRAGHRALSLKAMSAIELELLREDFQADEQAYLNSVGRVGLPMVGTVMEMV